MDGAFENLLCDPSRPDNPADPKIVAVTERETASANYDGTTGTFCLRSAFITCGSRFKCAFTSSGGVSAIH